MENAQPEPSMEEILASIRRIISEDEDDSAQAETDVASSDGDDDKAERVEAGEDLSSALEDATQDQSAATAAETEGLEMLKQNISSAAAESAENAILDTAAATAASQAFQSLSDTVRVTDGGGRTLEEIVIAILNPMIKEWLNANLPAIVEEKVEEEVQRVARRRRS